MELKASGVEYARWTITADVPLDGSPPRVGLTAHRTETVWHDSEWADVSAGARRRAFRLLVAGPAAEAGDEAVVLELGTWRTQVDFVDTPEHVVRGTSAIEVVE